MASTKFAGTNQGTVVGTTPKLGQRLGASDWVTLLSAFGPAALSAIGSAGASSADRKRQAELDAWNRAQADYARRMGARSGLANFYADQLDRQGTAARALAAQMPLGAEQDLALRMGAMRGLTQAGQTFNPQANIPGFLQGRLSGTPNYFEGWTRPDVMAAISPEATAASMAERRKALAGIDPTFQFGDMSAYGVPDRGGEVSQYAGAVRDRQQAAEGSLLNYLQQQMQEAEQPLVPASGTQTGQPTSQKTPWWKRALKVAATAAPIIAAPFTGGSSLAMGLIGAGSGALSGGLDGGLKGALLGGAMGGAGGALGARGMAGSGLLKSGQESARSAIQRAILNPQALGQLGSAAIGGNTGMLMGMASNFLPGMKGAPQLPSSQPLQAQTAPMTLAGASAQPSNLGYNATSGFSPEGVNVRGVAQGTADAFAPTPSAPRPELGGFGTRGSAVAQSVYPGSATPGMPSLSSQDLLRFAVQAFQAGRLTPAQFQTLLTRYAPAPAAYNFGPTRS